MGQPDFGQAAVLTAAVASGAAQRTSELDHLPQCFQYQAPAEAAALAPVAATAQLGGNMTAAVGAADQPAHFQATRCEVECCLLAAAVAAAAATASHVHACDPALHPDLVASCAPALCSALGPAPAASH